MTTLSQLDKYADKWFNDQMRRRGFAVERKFAYWRKRGPLYDMFWSEILSSGNNLRMNVTIWSPWVDHPDGDLGDFPPGKSLIGGNLSDRFPETMQSGELFSIDTEAAIESSLSNLLTLIDICALPWFSTINSYETYTFYLGRRGFHPTPEYREKIKQGIARGFEREPFSDTQTNHPTSAISRPVPVTAIAKEGSSPADSRRTYEVHITRTEDWVDSESGPITLDEWKAVVDADVDLSMASIVRMTGPTRVPLREAWLADWKDAAGDVLCVFRYTKGRVTVGDPSEAAIAKMKVIAKALNAKVRGGDGKHF